MKGPREGSSAEDAAYEPISLGVGWGALSLGFFLLTLPMPKLLRLLPWRPTNAWMWPVWIVVGTALAAGVGLLTGAIGWRTTGRQAARWGFFLNAVVLGLVALTFLAFVWIRYRR